MARRRGIKKQFWFNKEEATMLKKKSKKYEKYIKYRHRDKISAID